MIARAASALSLAAALAALAGCATRPASPVPVACGDFSFPIYFATNSDELTPAARQVIADSAARVRACRVDQVMVLGLADADGSARSNLALSRRRAQSVAKALAAGGLPAPKFDIEAQGPSGARTTTGEPEPLRRRAEVVIHAQAAATKAP